MKGAGGMETWTDVCKCGHLRLSHKFGQRCEYAGPEPLTQAVTDKPCGCDRFAASA